MLRPERFVAGGEALARADDGRVVFVRGAVPGDEVDVEPVEDSGDWSRVVVTRVVRPSPDRVEPPCPQRREGCGGCDWQHVAVPAQLPAKAAIVRDALRRTARLPDAEVRIGGSVPVEGYRTTIRIVGDRDGRPAYRRERSNDTVATAGCRIAHPVLRDLVDRITVTPGLEVTLRTSVATGGATAWWDAAGGTVDGLPDHVGTGPGAALDETVAGHRFRVSAPSFFQSGPAAADLLVDAVGRAAPELATARSVVDLYAGVGLFAATVAPRAARLVTVESNRSAVADCGHNLAGRAAAVVAGEVGRWRPATGGITPDAPADVVIADPARTGLGRPGVATVVACGAPVVVLVSCDPVAAARDTGLLAGHGYTHDGTEVLDLFPHTHHVETVTRFVRR